MSGYEEVGWKWLCGGREGWRALIVFGLVAIPGARSFLFWHGLVGKVRLSCLGLGEGLVGRFLLDVGDVMLCPVRIVHSLCLWSFSWGMYN